MENLAEELHHMAQLFSQASAAVSVLEAIEGVLLDLQDGELTEEEALEEIEGLVAEYQALRALWEKDPEEILEMAKEDDQGLSS
ncbi:MAG: hypothetical protein ACUVS9_05405 [Thermaceae bacterium]